MGESDIFSSYFQRWRLDYEKVSEGWLGTHSRSNLAVRQSSGNLVASNLVDSSDTFSFAIVSRRNVSHSEAQLDVTESGRQRKRIDGTRPFYRSRAWRHHAQFYVTLTIRQVYLIHPSPLLLLLIWRVDSNIFFCVCVSVIFLFFPVDHFQEHPAASTRGWITKEIQKKRNGARAPSLLQRSSSNPTTQVYLTSHGSHSIWYHIKKIRRTNSS